MPFEPLRFLHAANVRLDDAIGETFPLPPRVASIVQDATRAACERLLSVALERRVDFVLLAGNTFIEADHSLPARLALVDGLEQLHQESIRVFVLPGRLDPVEAWQQIPNLPENVTLLDGTAKGPVAFKREGKTIARLGTTARLSGRKRLSPQRALRSENARPLPFAIGVVATHSDLEDAHLLEAWSAGQERGDHALPEEELDFSNPDSQMGESPVDYLAFGSGRARRTFAKRKGIAHDPGSVQGNHPREAGPRGATFVNVEADGTVSCDFVPTASVRWERFSIPLDGATNHFDLLHRCRLLLQEKRGETSENAWIVEWVLRGSAATLDPFDAAACRRFAHELNEAGLLPGAEAIVHNVVLHADWETPLSHPAENPLYADFIEALAACHRDFPTAFSPVVAELAGANREWAGAWAARLEALAAHSDEAAIGAHAQRLGRKLFHKPVVERAAGEGASA
jgi:DNA repair protein SbcD/Mre11